MGKYNYRRAVESLIFPSQLVQRLALENSRRIYLLFGVWNGSDYFVVAGML